MDQRIDAAERRQRLVNPALVTGGIERIIEAVKKLSAFCQTFFLSILEQRDREEIRELLGADSSQGAFRKRIFDCRLKLKALLQE